MAAVIVIFLDKLKGDDIYFNIDVKEQEIKKVIEDAEEILSELNFTSDVIVKEIEDKINNLNKIYSNVNNSIAQLNSRPMVVEQAVSNQSTIMPTNPTIVEKTVVKAKLKPMSITPVNKNLKKEEKPKSKQEIIFELAGQGTSVIDIAKKMNMGQGEVALILSLKNEEN
jgi:DNA-binding NarL/FixJ family response regulator